ncbi:MAG: pyridoxamine 5'-phosphate oxidase family protein [Actinomycetota bacterium]
MRERWSIEDGFDLDVFLARPLVAHLATTGPTVRPIWFLWEEDTFWWLTGSSWSNLAEYLARDPHASVVVDSCDLTTGEVKRVTARGVAEIVAFDQERAHRKLERYLGGDDSTWDPRFTAETFGDPTARLGRLQPVTLNARDISFQVHANA